MAKAKISTFIFELSACFLACLGLALAPCPQTASAQGEEEYNDQYFNARFDFMAVLKINRLDDLTNYPGCTLKPIGQVSVSYKAHSRSNPNMVLPLTPYEDLWYHDYSPIGCRRHRDMPPECTGFGVVRVLPSADQDDFTNALANAAIRLVLDMNLHGCACQTVIVPKDIFYPLFSSFSRYGYYEVQTKPEHFLPGVLTLTLLSDPPGDSRRLYFHNPPPTGSID